MPYTYTQIARELRATASGQSYHGNALFVAKDIPQVVASPEHHLAIQRYLSGRQNDTDHIRLAEAANIVESLATHGGARPGAGRPEAPYERVTVSFEIPVPLRDKWDAHCAKHKLSRPASVAKWLKWKKPKRPSKKK